jgi:predicted nucleic acid-binding Zn ribbon protein
MSQNTIENDVYKITMYMTPSQWNNMSQWSIDATIAAHKSGNPRDGSWLYLSHETNSSDQYAIALQNMQSDQYAIALQNS